MVRGWLDADCSRRPGVGLRCIQPDYGSQQKPTHDAVPSLQFGASVRVASAGNFRAYLRAGAIRAYLGHTTLTTPLIGVGARHGGRYGIAASLDYGTAREVTTVASMVGFYLGF